MRRVLGVLAGSAFTGLLLAAALPPSQMGFLGWVCLAPLLISIRSTRFLVGFVGGLLALSVTGLIVRSGVLYEHKYWEGDPTWIASGCTFFGFAIAITSAVWAEDPGSKRPIWWYAFLAVVLEACLLIQLPGHLALTQYRSPIVLLAALGGIWLISFAVWMMNLWIARTIDQRTSRSVFVAALLIAVSALDWKPNSKEGLAVGFVQSSSIDLTELSKLQEMTLHSGATVTVWPEYSGYGSTAQGDTEKLKTYSATEGGMAFVTSFPDGLRPYPHNVASLFLSGQESKRYAKRMLFGSESKDHVPGKEPVAAKLPAGGAIGLNICFDSCYPWILRDTARLPNVVLVALPNNDPASPHHFIAAVHSAFTTIRAAELGMPIVRADVRANSLIVNAWGQIVAEAPPGVAFDVGRVGPPHTTPARILGDWFLYLCIFGVVGYPVSERMRRVSQKEKRTPSTSR